MRIYPDGSYRPSMLPDNVGDKSTRHWWHRTDTRIPVGITIVDRRAPDYLQPGWHVLRVGDVWCEEMGAFPSYNEGVFSSFQEALDAARE